MKYFVTFAVDSRVTIPVEVPKGDFNTAKEMAKAEFMTLPILVDSKEASLEVVDTIPVNACNENDELYDFI